MIYDSTKEEKKKEINEYFTFKKSCRFSSCRCEIKISMFRSGNTLVRKEKGQTLI
jgi:hypothetical protein